MPDENKDGLIGLEGDEGSDLIGTTLTFVLPPLCATSTTHNEPKHQILIHFQPSIKFSFSRVDVRPGDGPSLDAGDVAEEVRLGLGLVGVADGHLGGLAAVGLVAVSLVGAEHAVPHGHVHRVARRKGVTD